MSHRQPFEIRRQNFIKPKGNSCSRVFLFLSVFFYSCRIKQVQGNGLCFLGGFPPPIPADLESPQTFVEIFKLFSELITTTRTLTAVPSLLFNSLPLLSPFFPEIEKIQKDEGKEEEKFIDVVINKNMKLGQKVLIPVKQFPKVSATKVPPPERSLRMWCVRIENFRYVLFIDNEVNYSSAGFDLNSFQQPLDTFCWCFMLLDVAYLEDCVEAERWLTELG